MEAQVAAMEAEATAEQRRSDTVLSTDLGRLPSVSEQRIATCLRDRLLAGRIYTWAGSNLVAVNPFEQVPEDAEDGGTQLSLHNAQAAKLPAHVHSIALRALHGLCAGVDQTVIISGESGAGKTFSAHRMLHFLVRMEGAGLGEDEPGPLVMERRLNVSSPLLEAFGNARTTNNGNSSRFCKLSRLAYSADGRLSGGALYTCLFEKTRINWQANGERSFHVFYQMRAGLPAASLRTLGLERLGELVAFAGQPCASDRADFAVTEAAMTELGLSGRQRAAIFAVLAALLHFGQLTAVPQQDGVAVAQDARLACACRLLGISITHLAEALSVQQLTVGGKGLVRRPCTTEAELRARSDCMVRQLYERLFNWLVDWINVQIAPENAPPRAISLLDISGFESLSTNSLEQLCINYTNERLQQFFLGSFLRRLELAFVEEGLLATPLQYPDNAATVAALDGPAPSVFGAVDEATGLRQLVTGHDLSAAVQRAVCAFPAPGGRQMFTVRHFCGPVIYEADQLVEKNRDRWDGALLAVMAESSVELVRALAVAAESGGGTARRRHTVLARLQLAVRRLLDRLADCDVQYVRCVRPNSVGRPRLVEEAYLRRQLRSAGVVATAQLCAAGFPFRLTPDEVVVRFATLIGSAHRHLSPRCQVKQMLTNWGISEAEVRIGKSHVFLTQSAWFRMCRLCQLKLQSAASTLQRWWRRKRRDRAARILQRAVRTWLEERRRERAARTLQRAVCVWLNKCRRDRAAKILQRAVRVWLARLRRERAARVVQLTVRRWLQRRRREAVREWLCERKRRRAAETVQRRVRAWLATARRHRAAAVLQRVVRSWLLRRRRQRAALVIQRAFRRCTATRRVGRRHGTVGSVGRPTSATVDTSDADSGVSLSLSWRSLASADARRWSPRGLDSEAASLSSVVSVDLSPRGSAEEPAAAIARAQRLWAPYNRPRPLSDLGPSRALDIRYAEPAAKSIENVSSGAHQLRGRSNSSLQRPCADLSTRLASTKPVRRPGPCSQLMMRSVFVGDGIMSTRHVSRQPVRFHTRRTCLPFSCELPRALLSAGLADLL